MGVGRPDLDAFPPDEVDELRRTGEPVRYFDTELDKRHWEQLAHRLKNSRDHGMSTSHCHNIERRMLLLVREVRVVASSEGP
jgi:hypothetical protein